MAGFQYSGESRSQGARPWPRTFEMDASTTLTIGDLLVPTTNGKLIKVAAQTTKPEFIANETKTSTATGGETIEVVDALRGGAIWVSKFTPMFADKVAGSGSATSIVLSDASLNFSSDDWKGGQIYCKETNEQRTITASSTTGAGPYVTTFTVTQPFSKSSTGLTFSATPLGLDVLAGKLIASTFDTLSQVIADLTGGPCQVIKVDLIKRLVYNVFIP